MCCEDTGFHKLESSPQNHRQQKQNNKRMRSHQTERFSTAMQQENEMENMAANDTADRELVHKIYEGYSSITTKIIALKTGP